MFSFRENATLGRMDHMPCALRKRITRSGVRGLGQNRCRMTDIPSGSDEVLACIEGYQAHRQEVFG